MAVFCPKCNKKTYDEFTCDFCRYEIKKDKVYDQIIQQNKKRNKRYSNENKSNPLLIVIAGAVVIIALVGVYFAYEKYQEKQAYNKMLEMTLGTSDTDELVKMYGNGIKDMEKYMDKLTKQQKEMMEKAMKQNPYNK